MFIVSNESSVSRPVELKSPTARAVGVQEIIKEPFLIFFSSGAKVTTCSVDVKGGECRRNRMEGQRDSDLLRGHPADTFGLQWRSLIELWVKRSRDVSIVLCSCKKNNNKKRITPVRPSVVFRSSPPSSKCLTTYPTQYLTRLPSTSPLTRGRVPSSLTSPSSLHCPVQCPGYRGTSPTKLLIPLLPLPFGYLNPSSTTSLDGSSKLRR